MKFVNSALQRKRSRHHFSAFISVLAAITITVSGLFSASEIVDIQPVHINKKNPESLFRETVATYYSNGSHRRYRYIYRLSAVVWDECYMRRNIDPYLAAALIQAESEWRMVPGKPVKVNLSGDRSGVYRAVGLMQVMPFNHPGGEQPLWSPVTNIQYGCKILARYAAGRTIVDSLKNYNSGPASKHYNWPYIRKIIAHRQRTIELATETEQSNIALIRLVNIYWK